jgi:hypothetical protein
MMMATVLASGFTWKEFRFGKNITYIYGAIPQMPPKKIIIPDKWHM